MKISVSTWSIRNPIPAILLFLILSLAGIYSFRAMPINNMPSFSLPLISVTVAQLGASPEEMEAQITRKVENAVAGIQGIKHISSTISMGSSSTVIEFNLEVDIDRAFIDTRSAIANIRATLPQSIDEPLVQRIDIDGGAVAIYTVSAPEKSMEELSWYIDDVLSRELLALRGVAQVSRMGGIDREITVSLDPDKLAAYGVSAADVSRQLARVHTDMPGGRLVMHDTEFMLRTLANAATIERLEQVAIPLANGGYLQLGDIAEITDGGAELRTLSRNDGRPVVGFAVFRTKNASEVNVAHMIDARLQEISANDSTVLFHKVFSLASFTEISFDSAMHAFLEGTMLTVAVVFLFLRAWRSTLIAAVTIPLSIIPTFAIMHMLGFTLNGVSLLAISLVTGVLVDDAIVEIENVHRHMAKGKKAYDAAIIAADEIGLAVIATTSVICAIFTPVGFMPGVTGQIFKQFGLTVAIAAFFSLLVARLLTPMLCAYLLRNKPHTQEKETPPGFILAFYGRLVEWTLRHRLLTLAIAAACLVGSFSMIPFLSMGFIPYEDYSRSVMKLELPYGSTLEQTDAVARRIATELKKHKEVDSVLTTVNGGALGQQGEGVNQASIETRLVPPGERELDQKAFDNAMLAELKDIPDVRINFANLEGAKDLTFALMGTNDALLLETARKIEREMRGIPGITSVSNTAGQTQPEILIRPKPVQAAQLGISTEQISNALLVATVGDIDTALAKFSEGSRQIPIRIRLPQQSYTEIDVLRNLSVSTANGVSVPLSAVADFSIAAGPNSIERYERQRKISLEANLAGLSLGDAMGQIMELPTMRNLPEGIKLQQTGELEIMEEMNNGFAFAVITGLLLVYAVQVLLYKDWIQPLTRMAALPLSIGGAFILLLTTGTELNMPAIIGMLTLMGIADKNSILLVDYMLEKVHSGMPKNQAILEGCMARARPIVMTSMAMIAGMLPIVMGLTLQSAFRAPMAIAVIGGVISSTLLSLIFVPVFFSYVRDFEEWLFPKLRKIIR